MPTVCIELYRFVVCPFHSEVRAPFGLRVTHGRISLSMRRLSPCRPTRFNARSISSLEEKFVHVLNHSRHVALELPPLPQDESEEHLNDAERWDPTGRSNRAKILLLFGFVTIALCTAIDTSSSFSLGFRYAGSV
jgi:hypothetical protein